MRVGTGKEIFYEWIEASENLEDMLIALGSPDIYERVEDAIRTIAGCDFHPYYDTRFIIASVEDDAGWAVKLCPPSEEE